MARKLDPYTLEAAARKLIDRAELLRRCHERKGWSQKHHFIHRAAELEFMADGLSYASVALTKTPKAARKRNG